MTVFVITYRYTDNSGSGAVCALPSLPTAEKFLQLIKGIGDTMKTFEIVEAPCFP